MSEFAETSGVNGSVPPSVRMARRFASTNPLIRLQPALSGLRSWTLSFPTSSRFIRTQCLAILQQTQRVVADPFGRGHCPENRFFVQVACDSFCEMTYRGATCRGSIRGSHQIRLNDFFPTTTKFATFGGSSAQETPSSQNRPCRFPSWECGLRPTC